MQQLYKTRRRVWETLSQAEGSLSSQEIARTLKISVPSTNKHLHALVNIGVIDRSTKKPAQGRWFYVYSAKNDPRLIMSPTCLRVLNFIRGADVSVSTREIGHSLHLHMTTASRHALRLSEVGLVERDAVSGREYAYRAEGVVFKRPPEPEPEPKYDSPLDGWWGVVREAVVRAQPTWPKGDRGRRG
jgi:predicted transcriptional regulator